MARRSVKPGDRLEVYWEDDEAYYAGVVASRLRGGKVRVLYDDGDVELLLLREEKWRLLEQNNGSSKKTGVVEGPGSEVEEADDSGEDTDDPEVTKAGAEIASIEETKVTKKPSAGPRQSTGTASEDGAATVPEAKKAPAAGATPARPAASAGPEETSFSGQKRVKITKKRSLPTVASTAKRRKMERPMQRGSDCAPIVGATAAEIPAGLTKSMKVVQRAALMQSTPEGTSSPRKSLGSHTKSSDTVQESASGSKLARESSNIRLGALGSLNENSPSNTKLSTISKTPLNAKEESRLVGQARKDDTVPEVKANANLPLGPLKTKEGVLREKAKDQHLSFMSTVITRCVNKSRGPRGIIAGCMQNGRSVGQDIEGGILEPVDAKPSGAGGSKPPTIGGTCPNSSSLQNAAAIIGTSTVSQQQRPSLEISQSHEGREQHQKTPECASRSPPLSTLLKQSTSPNLSGAHSRGNLLSPAPLEPKLSPPVPAMAPNSLSRIGVVSCAIDNKNRDSVTTAPLSQKREEPVSFGAVKKNTASLGLKSRGRKVDKTASRGGNISSTSPTPTVQALSKTLTAKKVRKSDMDVAVQGDAAKYPERHPSYGLAFSRDFIPRKKATLAENPDVALVAFKQMRKARRTSSASRQIACGLPTSAEAREIPYISQSRITKLGDDRLPTNPLRAVLKESSNETEERLSPLRKENSLPASGLRLVNAGSGKSQDPNMANVPRGNMDDYPPSPIDAPFSEPRALNPASRFDSREIDSTGTGQSPDHRKAISTLPEIGVHAAICEGGSMKSHGQDVELRLSTTPVSNPTEAIRPAQLNNSSAATSIRASFGKQRADSRNGTSLRTAERIQKPKVTRMPLDKIINGLAAASQKSFEKAFGEMAKRIEDVFETSTQRHQKHLQELGKANARLDQLQKEVRQLQALSDTFVSSREVASAVADMRRNLESMLVEDVYRFSFFRQKKFQETLRIDVQRTMSSICLEAVKGSRDMLSDVFKEGVSTLNKR